MRISNVKPVIHHNGNRVIDLDDHPKNLAVFTATSMKEAIRLADKALRRDGIQGAVWWRAPDPNANKNAFRLLKVFEERAKVPEARNAFSSGKTIHVERSVSRPVSVKFSLADIFTDQLQQDFNDHFLFGQRCEELNVHFQCKNMQLLHYDDLHSKISDHEKAKPRKLFQGFETAAIMSQTVAGTLIVETDETGYPAAQLSKYGSVEVNRDALSGAWMLGLNSWLFFHPYWTEFGLKKGLAHSFPAFDIPPDEISETNPPRVFYRADFQVLNR